MASIFFRYQVRLKGNINMLLNSLIGPVLLLVQSCLLQTVTLQYKIEYHLEPLALASLEMGRIKMYRTWECKSSGKDKSSCLGLLSTKMATSELTAEERNNNNNKINNLSMNFLNFS